MSRSISIINKKKILSQRGLKCAALFAAAFCLLIAAFTMSGCTAPTGAANQGSAEDQAMTSSEYMAEVNQVVEKLSERLQSFDDAVSRQDPITMRTQADSAFAVLDELAAIEAPDDVKDLRDQYIKGCDQLKDALNSYIDLYSDMSAAKALASSSSRNAPSFNASNYTDRIKEIQSKYDEGIKTLEDADSSAKDR